MAPRALLRSIPTIHEMKRGELPTLVGSVPHPYNRPTGCPFHPRCDAFMPDLCERVAPQLLPVGERQSVSCLLYEQSNLTDSDPSETQE